MELASMKNTKPFDNLRLALVGKTHSGKSRLAATGRKDVLFFDYDQRKESIAGIDGVHAITFRDARWPNQPTVYQETLDMVAKLEESLELRKLFSEGSPFAFDAPDGTMVKTIVLDSMQFLGKSAMAYALYNTPSLRREINISAGGQSLQFHFSASWDGWETELAMVETVIMRLFAIKDLDVIITLHETMEKAQDSTEKDPKYTGKVSVYPVRYNRLVINFSELWRMKLVPSMDDPNREVPKVQVLQSYEFSAATCMELDYIEEPNIENMIRKHSMGGKLLSK